jgi:hypothetical protein
MTKKKGEELVVMRLGCKIHVNFGAEVWLHRMIPRD